MLNTHLWDFLQKSKPLKEQENKLISLFWIFTTNGMAITVEPLNFENNCVEGRQARDNNYLEIERDTREEWKLGEKNQETP